MRKTIAIEGNIGAGKSHLAGRIKGMPEISVFDEIINEGMLALFYDDPKRYGFTMQWGMLKTRKYQAELSKILLSGMLTSGRSTTDHITSSVGNKSLTPTDHTPSPSSIGVWDRSMVGDHIFALWNYLQGSISEAEMKVYEAEAGGSFTDSSVWPQFSDSVSIFLYLDDHPDRCKQRTEKRGVKAEREIPIDYYTGIDDIHFHVFTRIIIPYRIEIPVVIASWEQYECKDLTDDYVHEWLQGVLQSAGCRIGYIEKRPQDPECVVYDTEDDIIRMYNSVYRDGEIGEIISKVYIHRDIMIIERPDVIKERSDRYNITYYRNEYKRVVMYHLSVGSHIIFYRM